MLLRAGLVSLSLLLASRLLGLLRESVQAAALGATGLADVAILVLTLPDLLTGILAAGALSYVLLPLWARQTMGQQAATQARLGRLLLGAGLLAGVALVALPDVVTQLLAPGLSTSGAQAARGALWWSALAMPLALLAALWITRLQHLRDFTGMYGANLVINAAVIGALLFMGWRVGPLQARPLLVLGLGLLLGMGMRLVWLRWRLAQACPDVPIPLHDAAEPGWPLPSVWLWALVSAGLPMALPLLGRSLASSAGEGALTTFNYAWKLVELPLVLAVQLVATLSFPGIARAFSSQVDATGQADQRKAQTAVLRSAFTLAWVLACAAAAALSAMSVPLAQLLFGWGRMSPEAVLQIAHWSRIGAWSLLPQALLAVLLTLLASTGRLRGAVLAYGGALLLLAALAWAVHLRAEVDGRVVMWGINAALALAAMALWLRERAVLQGVLQIRDVAPAALAAGVLALVGALLPAPDRLPGLGMALVIALCVCVSAWLWSPALRIALRR